MWLFSQMHRRRQDRRTSATLSANTEEVWITMMISNPIVSVCSKVCFIDGYNIKGFGFHVSAPHDQYYHNFCARKKGGVRGVFNV